MDFVEAGAAAAAVAMSYLVLSGFPKDGDFARQR
jgi:hypothetical protein